MREITQLEDFEEMKKTAANKLLVLEFGAGWCGPCRLMAPFFESLDEKYGGKVVFAKVDVDELSDLAEECGIEVMPTFVFFKKGEKIAMMAGANKEKLLEIIDENK